MMAGGRTLDLDLWDQLNNLFNVTKHTLTNRTQTVHGPVPPLPHLHQYSSLIGRAVAWCALIGPAPARPCAAHPNNGLLAYWMSAPLQLSVQSSIRLSRGKWCVPISTLGVKHLDLDQSYVQIFTLKLQPFKQKLRLKLLVLTECFKVFVYRHIAATSQLH